LWDVLIEEKKSRTILLTTHYMDEADVLGDRIAIMNDGVLQTVGSSYFLKKKFGTGYRLTCEKSAGCEAAIVLEFLRNLVEDVKMESNSSTEITFIIGEDNLPRFKDIFKELEDNSDLLRTSSFGCSLTSLEEVFIKIGSDSYVTDQNGNAEDPCRDQSEFSVLNFDNRSRQNQVDGVTLLIYQAQAILFKKWFYLCRNFKPLINYGLLSIILIYLFFAESLFTFSEPDSLRISFATYEQTATVVEADNWNDR